jgi:dienelactone hydrolase
MISKINVAIPAEGKMTLGAWLFRPVGTGPHPAITMAHGYAGTKEHGIESFARAFAEAGFVILTPVKR